MPAPTARPIRRPRALPSLAAALFGFWWFTRLADWRILSPLRVGWLLVADWGAHQLGWMFFRNDPWMFPIGRYRSLIYPVGSTVGFSDSIPALAVVTKALSPVLPSEIQYIGPWLASCFVLQGLVGASIAGKFVRDDLSKAIAGMLFTTAPTLLLRVGHPSLCAHWILLLLILLHLRTAPGMRTVGAGVGVALFAATIHPYLAVMALALTLALIVRVRPISALPFWRVGAAVGLTAGLVAIFWSLGYLGSKIEVMGGNFDRYGADLTTFFNSMGYSSHVPPLPMTPSANEGFAYLGGGLLFLVGMAIVLFSPLQLRWRNWRVILPVSAACIGLAIFSAGPIVRFGGTQVFSMYWLYGHFRKLVDTFRSSGRFIWPLYYLCFVFAIAVVGAAFQKRPWVARIVLSIALLLQIADLDCDQTRARFNVDRFVPPQRPAWQLAKGDYDHLALYPLQIESAPCGAGFDQHKVYTLAYLAATLRMSINSGYMARLDLDGVLDMCRKMEEQEGHGILDDRTVYIVARPNDLPAGVATCGELDGYVACVAANRETAFQRALSGVATSG